MGLRADSARPQRVSGSARTDSRRAESARNPITSHVIFGDDSALNALTRTYYGFQTVCKCPFGALLVTLVTDSNQTWAN